MFETYRKKVELLIKVIPLIKQTEPDWTIYDFKKFPSIQWKLKNLNTLKKANPTKHQQQYDLLREKLRY